MRIRILLFTLLRIWIQLPKKLRIRIRNHAFKYLTGGFYEFFSFYCIQHCFIRFHSVGGCGDRNQDCCDFGIGSQML
jgi:hypothetical protein